jgi:hypothetical protein
MTESLQANGTCVLCVCVSHSLPLSHQLFINLYNISEGGCLQHQSVSFSLQVATGNIGFIYKVRIAHDNSEGFPAWYCDEVGPVGSNQ